MNKRILVKHSLGFLELKNKPSASELQKYYQDKYFDNKNFEIEYSKEESSHKNINFIEALEISTLKMGKMLDIGCGEGFSLNFFSQLGWEVVGLDYNDDGVTRHFPQQLKDLRKGNIEASMAKAIENGEKFDLIICNNVLEHILEPLDFIGNFKHLLSDEGLARVQVPNDDSYLQRDAAKRGLAEENFWIAPHEHMSYFTHDSLKSLVSSYNFNVKEVLGDFPIDFFLFNEDSNYLLDSKKGKACHHARMKIDNLMAQMDPQKLVNFRRGCGSSGLGRNAIIYFSL